MEPAATRTGVPKGKLIGVFLGPSLFALVLLTPRPEGMSPAAQGVLALTMWMAAWWMSGAAPLAATSFLPLVVLPVAGIVAPAEAAAPYADPNVFLFMGGFLLAAAFQKSGLHRRIALMVLARVGDSPRRLVFAFMATTAVFSMWVSNTATAVMMLPVGVAVASQVGAESAARSKWRYGLKTVLMLGIAYAASIGGMATLVGTPPNLLFAGQVAALAPERGPIGFLEWMRLGLPLAAVYLTLAWAYLAYGILDPTQAKARARPPDAEVARPLSELGPLRREEWIVATVFGATVLAWLTRADIPLGETTIRGWASLLGLGVHDATVAMAAAILLFILPTDLKRGEFALDWRTAVSIPWEVLILFGGGFALASAFDASGLASWIGGLAGALGGLPLPLLVFGLTLLVVAGSEIASNTAQTALMLPILASVAAGLDLDPLWLMVPATLAASSGFMLPVATPPNAVAFASGHVTVPQMVRAGIVLDVMGALLATAATFTLARWVFGLV